MCFFVDNLSKCAILGSIADKYTRAGKLRAKSNMNMTRSQKNLDWVKSKFASLKANINEAQVHILNKEITFVSISIVLGVHPHSQHTRPVRSLCFHSPCSFLKIYRHSKAQNSNSKENSFPTIWWNFWFVRWSKKF